MANTGSIASIQYSKAVSGSGYKTHYARGANSRLISVHKTKEKKMGWFKRKFAKWVREAWENSSSDEVYSKDTIRAHEGVNSKSSVRFTIYPASGGFVIEHYTQDRYKESDGPELTIVNNGDNIGTTIEHILTMEALKS